MRLSDLGRALIFKLGWAFYTSSIRRTLGFAPSGPMDEDEGEMPDWVRTGLASKYLDIAFAPSPANAPIPVQTSLSTFATPSSTP